MANGTHAIVLRIRGLNSEDNDWNIPSEITFRDVLEVMTRVLPYVTPTSFQYEDEDGDRITVRSDEELAAMIEYCQWRILQYGSSAMPLTIYPRASKNSTKRNIHGLSVNTRTKSTNSAMSSGGSSESHKSCLSNDTLMSLFSSGQQIYPQDLQYLEVLGHGTGGTVYRTHHIPSRTVMAVKVIQLDATPDEQRKIMSELDILHKCESRYIIGFYGVFFTEDNRISMCMEYMDGGSLDTYGAIPEQVFGRIAVSVVSGLSYLWSLKIMHRDIKPSNILVNTLGHVKLCDFGVSVQLATSMTKTFIGSNAYMAPERIVGEEYGLHSDVWSLGITLFEMAIGKFPYLSDSTRTASMLPIELLQCIVNEQPPVLPADKFSPHLVDFVSQCMQKNYKSRPNVEGLLRHPFISLHMESPEEVISQWVIWTLEQRRLLMKKYPSEVSLASSSSSTYSSYSGLLTSNHIHQQSNMDTQ